MPKYYKRGWSLRAATRQTSRRRSPPSTRPIRLEIDASVRRWRTIRARDFMRQAETEAEDDAKGYNADLPKVPFDSTLLQQP